MKRSFPWIFAVLCGIGLAQAGDVDKFLKGLIKEKTQPTAPTQAAKKGLARVDLF